MNQSKLGKLLKTILIVGIIIGIPTIILGPFLLQNTDDILHSMFIIYPNGTLMLIITFEFMRLFKSLENNNPFNFLNVKILKNTGKVSFLMSVLWIIDLFYMIFVIKNTYINYIIVLLFLFILFFGVGVALYILSELFNKATKYKEENDLTI